MKFRRERTDDLELNLTPLIDVVFLLLIFFMVSTTFQNESEISLQLPKASEEPVEGDIPITIRADAQTPHQAVVTAMDAAAQLGLTRMSIATSLSP